jgi:hypothetical protein
MADVNSKEACNSCRFFSFALGDRMGICNRYPQSLNKSNKDWCGEYQLNEKSLSLDAMVQAMTEPVLLTELKKQRGRPKKS